METAFYPTTPHLSRLFQSTQRPLSLHAGSRADFAAWKAGTRAALRELLGFSRFERCPLSPVLGEPEDAGDFYRQPLRLQVEPDVWQTSYLLLPKRPISSPCPVVIAAHGHGSGGKTAIAGLDGNCDLLRANIEKYNYTYGTEFARRGYVVLCPDMRGFGQRREAGFQGDSPQEIVGSTCREINQMALSLGQTLAGMGAWDLMRLLDYAETRADWDSTRIACVGLSGGGAQTLWLSALDDRVRAAVISGYFYGYHDALLLLNSNCSCNYVPHLWENLDIGDLAALIAPRPLLIGTGDEDPLNGPRGPVNALEQASVTRRAYSLFGKEQNLVHHIFHGGHRWCGEKAYDFIAQALAPETAPAVQIPVSPFYRELAETLDTLLSPEDPSITSLSNGAALLYEWLPNVNWAGFYLLRGNTLVLGPFQGKPACTRIPLGKGVCGTAAAENRAVLVEDVHAFPGHIACDSASRSELVLPLRQDGKVVGVLDLDSPLPARFTEEDKAGLLPIAAQLSSYLGAL